GGRRIVRAHPFRGTGLHAEYYGAPDLTRPLLSRLDPAIDFDWGTGAADPSLPGDAFSARWSGRLLPRSSGPHTFTISTDDGARLWVNGRLLIDRFHAQGRKEHAGTIELAAWQPVDLRMEYLDTDGPAVARLFWTPPASTREIVPTEALFPPSATGTGLRGEYFDTPNLTDLKLARVDPTVDFAWGLTPPDPSMEAGNFSIRWSGQVEAAHTGTVTFTTVSDDGVRLRVDGRLLIDDWTVRGTAERSGRIDLVAGRRYDVTLEYFQAVSVAGVRLLWGSASQPQQVVPRERLFPAP
ncbi:MAG TPA: PA14 domain-containing protein, partial [Planctomycetota bacterium]|nr:PA14 domain-containing protein [Planctomycetota bacterium]